MAERVGARIAGYRIEALLSRGGMGEVYLAEQDSPRRKVALKLLAPELSEDSGFRERFARESEAAASIDHPNVIPIYQSGEANGTLFIAMRYVEGTDLRTLLANQGPLPPKRAVGICTQVADALEAAHERGLVHRDVKPANILIGRNDHAYLSDFGLIRRSEVSSGITKTGQFMGTIDYVAPEQIKGQAVDGRADIYSLGCVLYECLAGEPPFRRETEVATLYAHLEDSPPRPHVKRSEVSAYLDDVAVNAMATRPENRFVDARAMRDAMATTVVKEARREPRLRPVLAIMAGIAALALIASVVVVSNRSDEPPPAAARAPSKPPLNSAVEIDSESLETSLATTGLPRPVDRIQIDAGEGSVWWLSGDSLTQIDEQTQEAHAPISLLANGAGVDSLAIGFQTVWVGSRLGLQPIAPATGELLPEVKLSIPHSAANSNVSGQFFANGVAVGADSVWVTSDTFPRLIRVDPISHDEEAVVVTEGDTSGVAFGQQAAWVFDTFGSSVTKINPRTNDALLTREVSGNVDAIAVGEEAVWVLDASLGTVTSLDPQTLKPVGSSIRVGDEPTDIAVGLDAVWVANAGDGTISRIDPGTRQVESIEVGNSVLSLVAEETTDSIWVAVAAPPHG